MGRVVVTGGDGFIGSHLLRRLALAGERDVTVFDGPRDDVRDRDAVCAALRGASTVYHLAALPGAPPSPLSGPITLSDRLEERDAAAVFSTNVLGTFNVLHAAAQSGVSRVVFASSYEVYGEPADLPVDESHPLLALSCYAASKAAAEAYCRAFRRERGLDTVVLRLAEVYGPADTSGPIPRWIARAEHGQNLEVVRDRVSDFIWVGQAVEALVRAGHIDGPVPTINVGSGTGVRHADVARRIVTSLGSGSHVRSLPASDLRPLRFVADVRRMRDLLKLEPPLDPLAQLERVIPGAVGTPPPFPMPSVASPTFGVAPALRGVN